ncbi:hypothetical protein GGQ85_000247 [Nitrobacter vulgaris]|uniref:DUF7662 domain-containing protein n=1 Tax=Nitrobacter vulgaris TaxID=29421 RepID=UPI0028586E05|nr:hypothetical protein [Nitrobacter vulgaris]
MSVYDPLRHKLAANASQSLQMSFAEIEMLIGRSLPPSAYAYDAWWANEDPKKTAHSHSRAWIMAGYTAEPQRLRRTVTFIRES